MQNDRQWLTEVRVDGELYCVIRDLYEQNPPECNECGLLRFCERPRSAEDIDKLQVRVGRNAHRREFFEQMEDDGYYE